AITKGVRRAAGQKIKGYNVCNARAGSISRLSPFRRGLYIPPERDRLPTLLGARRGKAAACWRTIRVRKIFMINSGKYDLDRAHLAQLRKMGVELRRFCDIGGSDGEWSWHISQDFPQATFDLFEPLADRIPEYGETLK